ncbi:gamma-glutamyl-gamma-aminobutyrate hydrolase family protein [Acidaminococcus fermentans]|uniref:gamma-glutamyl-gamma-aminobutyrate hydrolase family protein n=1 Tax=Acidaminococcus fermentans TaxID=905 RepID=UPI00242D6374|nr:gamma-glutamyl-gamma-aminobutyrate hydrolase family protein [Acidaminococcus fermentans]
MKPLIGLTCNYDIDDSIGLNSLTGTAGQDWDFLAGDYVYAVEKAGGIPVILPRLENEKILLPFLEQLDGMILTGGHDVDPRRYGSRISGKCGRIVPNRDTMDFMLARYAYERKLPLLGVCRGIQVLGAFLGGSLYQDVESEGPFCHHFMDNSPREYPVHKNILEPGSLLYQIFGKTEIEVNSFHHQALKAVGPDAKVTAYSEDGLIEAIEAAGGNPFTLAVQWHPEMMFTSAEQQKIFQAFIRASEEFQQKKSSPV